MKVLVTGATGFLGREAVKAAASAGHHVVAMVRPTADITGLNWSPEQVTVVRGDLRQRGSWCDAVTSVDAIAHLAAAVGGDLPTQFSGTVVATENLLASIDPAELGRFVHVSSLAVYDYSALPAGATLDEATPVEPTPVRRDAYTTTKMLQEELVRTWCERNGVPHVVLRPGAIFGPGKHWDFGAAMRVFGVNLVFSPRAVFRLTYVTNCAAAVIAALSSPCAVNTTLNIVDDALPTHYEYLRLCRHAGAETGPALAVPWFALSAFGRVIETVDRLFLGGKARLPEFLTYRRQQARWKPLGYSNIAAKSALEWAPEIPVADGVAATVVAGVT